MVLQKTGGYEDRTALELSNDLHEEDFPKPRASRLQKELVNSRFTINGSRPKSFKISLSYVDELDSMFSEYIAELKAPDSGSILPVEWTEDSRIYLKKLAHQINGCFDAGFYDPCAVMMRRLMESLLIEAFINARKADLIKIEGNFVPLDKLINVAFSQSDFHWNRNSRKDVEAIKRIGDTAAHDRTAITHKKDVEDLKQRYRRLIQELFILAGVRK